MLGLHNFSKAATKIPPSLRRGALRKWHASRTIGIRAKGGPFASLRVCPYVLRPRPRYEAGRETDSLGCAKTIILPTAFESTRRGNNYCLACRVEWALSLFVGGVSPRPFSIFGDSIAAYILTLIERRTKRSNFCGTKTWSGGYGSGDGVRSSRRAGVTAGDLENGPRVALRVELDLGERVRRRGGSDSGPPNRIRESIGRGFVVTPVWRRLA